MSDRDDIPMESKILNPETGKLSNSEIKMGGINVNQYQSTHKSGVSGGETNNLDDIIEIENKNSVLSINSHVNISSHTINDELASNEQEMNLDWKIRDMMVYITLAGFLSTFLSSYELFKIFINLTIFLLCIFALLFLDSEKFSVFQKILSCAYSIANMLFHAHQIFIKETVHNLEVITVLNISIFSCSSTMLYILLIIACIFLKKRGYNCYDNHFKKYFMYKSIFIAIVIFFLSLIGALTKDMLFKNIMMLLTCMICMWYLFFLLWRIVLTTNVKNSDLIPCVLNILLYLTCSYFKMIFMWKTKATRHFSW